MSVDGNFLCQPELKKFRSSFPKLKLLLYVAPLLNNDSESTVQRLLLSNGSANKQQLHCNRGKGFLRGQARDILSRTSYKSVIQLVRRWLAS
jgi:hypothetical protein